MIDTKTYAMKFDGSLDEFDVRTRAEFLQFIKRHGVQPELVREIEWSIDEVTFQVEAGFNLVDLSTRLIGPIPSFLIARMTA